LLKIGLKNRHNSHLFVLLLMVSHFVTLLTSFLIQLLHHKSHICTVINGMTIGVL